MRKFRSLIFITFLISYSTYADFEGGINALGRFQYDLALAAFMPEAKQGNPIAQNFVAHTYREMQNYTHAYAWYHLNKHCNDSIDAKIELKIVELKMSKAAIETAITIGNNLYHRLCKQ